MAQTPPLGQLSTASVFNTKAVARETGVPADTFRAWERRYGVPRPQRTAGGHRLYSERDMAIIRWLRDRTDEGVNISHAVLLLTNTLDALEGEPPHNDDVRTLERLGDDFYQALAGFDQYHAERILGEAFALYPLEQVLIELIQPTLVEVGERWHRGEINVVAEHFATQFIRRKLAALLNMFDGHNYRATIVIGCAPSEQHDLGVLMAALFLLRRGWHVVYLGSQVPLADLLETVGVVKPALVCLSATVSETAGELAVVARALRERYPHIQVGFGGRIFNLNAELRQAVPATYLGRDARELADTVATLLARPTGGEA